MKRTTEEYYSFTNEACVREYAAYYLRVIRVLNKHHRNTKVLREAMVAYDVCCSDLRYCQ